ncbi:histidine utilization repressor, partial [Corynebacterium diphtheriae]
MITSQLESGDLKAGDPIPSENEFVSALGISRMTINRAMRELSNEGLLKRTRGIGTFVAEEKFPGDFMSVHNIAD